MKIDAYLCRASRIPLMFMDPSDGSISRTDDVHVLQNEMEPYVEGTDPLDGMIAHGRPHFIDGRRVTKLTITFDKEDWARVEVETDL